MDLDETVRLAEYGSLVDNKRPDDFNTHDAGINIREHAAPHYNAQQVY